METPSSMRRVTGSQASNFSEKNKHKHTSKSRKSRNQKRAALLDITNDSPIIGLAAEKTSSWAAKNRSEPKKTPGSGEALLRGQVKILLEKIVEAELVNQISVPLAADSVVSEDNVKIAESLEHEGSLNPPPPQECGITRALLFDSPSKSEASSKASSTASSSTTYQKGEVLTDDDNSSNWSLQVHASSCDGEEDEEEAEGEEDEFLDNLCEEMSKMKVKGDVEELRLPEFKGKHTRFVYNSDDEIEWVEEDFAGAGVAAGKSLSPSATVLKGLPVPEEKHLCFHE